MYLLPFVHPNIVSVSPHQPILGGKEGLLFSFISPSTASTDDRQTLELSITCMCQP